MFFFSEFVMKTVMIAFGRQRVHVRSIKNLTHPGLETQIWEAVHRWCGKWLIVRLVYTRIILG